MGACNIETEVGVYPFIVCDMTNERFLDALPETAGLYCFAAKGKNGLRPLYWGQTKDIQGRTNQHKKDDSWWSEADSFLYCEVPRSTEEMRRAAERDLLENYKARYNKQNNPPEAFSENFSSYVDYVTNLLAMKKMIEANRAS